MKSVVIVASHFPPSNLAAVHRARLWSLHLREFGWEPTILTVDWRYYEEPPDWNMLKLLPEWLRVIRVPALPARPKTVGDVGVRGFLWMRRALEELAEAGRMDFLHITIPSNFLAPLGRLLWQSHRVPYGIDYIDPWVHVWPGSERMGTRAWFSRKLSEILEPWSVRDAALITGINRSYFSGMLERNPAVAERVELAVMPYGGTVWDFEVAEKCDLPNDAFFPAPRREGDRLRWVYAGAFLPKSVPLMRAFFAAVRELREMGELPLRGLELVFIGTGKSPNDRDGFQVLPMAREAGVEGLVREHPHRMGYVEVLRNLREADGVLIIGSTELHYSPSKTYQALLSDRPIWVFLHEKSTAWEALDKEKGVCACRWPESGTLDLKDVVDSLKKAFLMEREAKRDLSRLERSVFSARASSEVLAKALDRALAREVKLG